MIFNTNRYSQAYLKNALNKIEAIFQPEVVFQYLKKQTSNQKPFFSNLIRYSPTNLKIYLKKLEVVFQPQNVEVILQIS